MAATICMNHLKLKSLTVHQHFYTYTDGDVMQSAKKAFKYLNDLFICPLPAFSISTGYVLNRKRLFFFGLKECSELFVNGEDKIKSAHLRSIFQKLVIRKRLFLDLPIGKDFKLNIATIKHPEEIYIRDAHWVTSDMKFLRNCSLLSLDNVKWTAKDCETFVARWLNSDDTFFCLSRLLWNDRVPEDLNFENLGVELREFDPEERSPAYRYPVLKSALDVSTGRDIIRKDGLMATLAVSEHIFIFCVWHQRHQNMDGVTETFRLF
ncbi:hypothetical protein CAEBREN_13828 [Caenorhabditis brenneri]|uniref:F-box associated domain-containing protein n=1 Tax=Caenorhabditis brenneri TaxID=135651 RepID=G0P5K0_CAEBE|nr:hypothetical protein CAEBREN_13828 [Caenorhabditis brenneri]